MPSKKQTSSQDNAASKRRSPQPKTQDFETLTQHVQPATIIKRARLDPSGLTSRDVRHLQAAIGNRTVSRLLTQAMPHGSSVSSRPVTQRKLAENAFGMPVQRQAELEEVQMKANPAVLQKQQMEEQALLQGKFRSVQRQSPEEEEEVLQGKFTPSEMPAQLQGDRGEAENHTGMPDRLKAGLEALSGMDLSGVRVHNNSSKPAQLNALAYTQGQDIHVGPGQEKHLPHEGWHAVQQMQGRVKPTMQANGLSINDDEKFEREADVMGAKAVQTKTHGVQPLSSGLTTQRKCESCSKEDEFITQKKPIQTSIANHPHLKIQRLESVRGISQLSNTQLQSTDETNNEEKRAEYEALQPESGTGSETRAARPAEPASFLREDEAFSQFKSDNVLQRVGCTPANTAVGNNALGFAETTRASWRSHVTYRARINNQSDHLTISMYVFAKVYYGLWVSWEHLRFNATVDLTCQSVNSSCEISANERGGSEWDLTDSPASGAISVQTDSRAGGTQMGLTVRVGGAVGANSSVSAGVGPASVGVSFPDASISQKMSMGTFIYTCRE